jgi:hypothetical protein
VGADFTNKNSKSMDSETKQLNVNRPCHFAAKSTLGTTAFNLQLDSSIFVQKVCEAKWLQIDLQIDSSNVSKMSAKS